VLPPVIEESETFPFKFWLNNGIHDGMYYRNELFYRLHSVSLENRARLYHYACKMARNDIVVVTATADRCSIWVSLRSPSMMAQTLRDQPLPPFVEPARELFPDNSQTSDDSQD
jgi:hypothetical protein